MLSLKRLYLFHQVLILSDLPHVALVSLSQVLNNLIILKCHITIPVLPLFGLLVLFVEQCPLFSLKLALFLLKRFHFILVLTHFDLARLKALHSLFLVHNWVFNLLPRLEKEWLWVSIEVLRPHFHHWGCVLAAEVLSERSGRSQTITESFRRFRRCWVSLHRLHVDAVLHKLLIVHWSFSRLVWERVTIISAKLKVFLITELVKAGCSIMLSLRSLVPSRDRSWLLLLGSVSLRGICDSYLTLWRHFDMFLSSIFITASSLLLALVLVKPLHNLIIFLLLVG